MSQGSQVNIFGVILTGGQGEPMKISCRCGNVLHDHTDNLPFKGYLRADKDDVTYAQALQKEVETVARRFRTADEARAERVLRNDVQEFGMVGVTLERLVYECTSCGRLLLPSPKTGRFLSFLPEDSERGVLSAKRET